MCRSRGGNSNKKLQWARSKFSKWHRLCTYNRTYNLDYVSNDLQLSTIEVGLKTFRRKVGEKPLRNPGRELGLGLIRSNNLHYHQYLVNYINHNQVWWKPYYGLASTYKRKSTLISNYSCIKLFMYQKIVTYYEQSQYALPHSILSSVELFSGMNV